MFKYFKLPWGPLKLEGAENVATENYHTTADDLLVNGEKYDFFLFLSLCNNNKMHILCDPSSKFFIRLFVIYFNLKILR